MANDSNSKPGVIHYNARHFPMYLLLVEHDRVLSCLEVLADLELTEIQEVLDNANKHCAHIGMPGKCLETKPATYKDWWNMH